MTLKRPTFNFWDRVLYGLGKTRGVILPDRIDPRYGPVPYVEIRKESFWRAFCRPKGNKLPRQMVDLREICRSIGVVTGPEDGPGSLPSGRD